MNEWTNEWTNECPSAKVLGPYHTHMMMSHGVMEPLRNDRPSRPELLVVAPPPPPPDITPQGKQHQPVCSRKAQLSQKLILKLQQCSGGDLNDDFSKVALAPALCTAIERHCEAELVAEVQKWKDSSKKLIDKFWKENYTQYLDSMGKVLAMRTQMGRMEGDVHEFYDRLIDHGQGVLRDYHAFLGNQKVASRIAASSNVVIRCQALVALAERAKDLLDAKSYTLALKTVHTLKEELNTGSSTNSSVTPFVVEKLKTWIPHVERKVRSEAVKGFETWLTDIDGEATSTAERLMNRCRDKLLKMKKQWVEQQKTQIQRKTPPPPSLQTTLPDERQLRRNSVSAQRDHRSRRGSSLAKTKQGDKTSLWGLSIAFSNDDNESDLKKLKLHCPPVYVLLNIFNRLDQLDACRQIYKERRFPVVTDLLQQLTRCTHTEQLLKLLPSKLFALLGFVCYSCAVLI
jgi:hypothetical protein